MVPFQNYNPLQKPKWRFLLGFFLGLSAYAEQEDPGNLYEGIWTAGEVTLVLHQNARFLYQDHSLHPFFELQGDWRVHEQTLVVKPDKVRIKKERVQPFPKEIPREYEFKINHDIQERPILILKDTTFRRTLYRVPDWEIWPGKLAQITDKPPLHPRISHLNFEPIRSLDLNVRLLEDNQLEFSLSTQRPFSQKSRLTVWEFRAPDYAWRIEMDMKEPTRSIRYGEIQEHHLQLIPEGNQAPRPLSEISRFFVRAELYYSLFFPPRVGKDVVVGIYRFTEEGELVMIKKREESF
jgi:hypothetical protein